jgi:hypothetical protein
MSDSTTNLLLPYLMAAQAQKHITHNDTLRLLDGLVQLSVKSRGLTAPPADPSASDRYIVASGATGAWAGWDLSVALWTDGAWLRLSPREGWRAWVEEEALLLVRTGAGWQPVIPTALEDLTWLGIGMAASAGSPFSAKLNSALWTALYAADGGSGDLTQTLNRETGTDDAGLILQTGFSTRALIGLFGSDQLRIAVSPDGSSFRDALGVDPATGIVDQPNLPRFKAYTNYDNYVATDSWTTLGINVAEYNDHGCFDAGTNRFVAPVAGTYLFGASLLYKINTNTSARMRGRLVLNGSTEVRGSLGEISSAHVSEASALWLQSLVPLDAGDTVALQGSFRAFDGYFAADHTTFWGAKIG